MTKSWHEDFMHEQFMFIYGQFHFHVFSCIKMMFPFMEMKILPQKFSLMKFSSIDILGAKCSFSCMEISSLCELISLYA